MSILNNWGFSKGQLTLKNLFEKQNPFLFLIGSGISLDAPSKLPTGYQFTESIVNSIFPTEKVSGLLRLMDPAREDMKSSNDFIRFELLVELIFDELDQKLEFLDIYTSNTPNFNHFFLAKVLMTTNNHSVFTTNIDSLIEHAIIELGGELELLNPIITVDQWSKHRYNQNRKKFYNLLKLHGSLKNLATGKETKDSLQVTLSRIGKESYNTISPINIVKGWVFEPEVANKDLIVLGYSGLDDFDILPTLQSYKSSKRIFWINHNPNYTTENAVIEVVKPNNSIKTEPKSHRVKNYLLSLISTATRQPDKIFIINVHTQDFLNWFWDNLINDPIPDLVQEIYLQTGITKSYKLPATMNPSPMMQWKLLGRLQQKLHHFNEALQSFQTALDLHLPLETNAAHEHVTQRLQIHIIDVYEAMKQIDKVFDFYLKLKPRTMFARIAQAAFLGKYYYWQGKLEKAIQKLTRAETLFDALCGGKIKSFIFDEKAAIESSKYGLKNILLLGDIKIDQNDETASIKIYNDAEILAEKTGNLIMNAHTAIKKGLWGLKYRFNVGNTIKQGTKNAISSFKYARDIGERFGDLELQTLSFYYIGTVYIKLKDYKQASIEIKESLRLASVLGDESLIKMVQNLKTIVGNKMEDSADELPV